MLSLQRIQNKALRFTYNEKYPFTKTSEELHSQANLLPINLTLHKRGNQIKHKLEEILDDTHTIKTQLQTTSKQETTTGLKGQSQILIKLIHSRYTKHIHRT